MTDALQGTCVLPCSFGQRRLWFLHELDPSSGGAYTGHAAVRLRGALDEDVLQHAVDHLVQRHEVLRTGLTTLDGEPVQAVHPTVKLPVSIREVDESGLREAILDVVAEPFAPAVPPLARVALLRLGADDRVLVFAFHHAISDLWSGTVFFRELAGTYAAMLAGRDPELPELPVQYGDYAAWLHEWAQTRAAEKQLAYWRDQLDELPVLELPTDRPRPPVQTYRGATTSLLLPAELVGELDALARRLGASRFMVLLAGFSAVLARHTGRLDIPIGSPYAGRDRPELEGLIGFFVNNLVLRTDLTGHPDFTELLARVRETCLQAYAHPDVPFEQLVEQLRPVRDLSRSPLFQVALMLANTPPAAPDFAGLEVEPVEVDAGTAKFDLFLRLVPEGDGLRASLEYNTDLFDAGRADRMLAHLRTLLAAAVREPRRPVESLPMLGEDERRALRNWGRGRETAPARELLPQQMQRRAAELGEAVATSFPDGSAALSYRELNARANRLAHHLAGQGIGSGDVVAVRLERDPVLPSVLLGVLKAGAAYLPLDPALPEQRARFLLADSGARMLLTSPDLRLDAEGVRVCSDIDGETAHEHDHDPEPVATEEDPAYLLYTSGSTGTPKGVLVPHRALANFLGSMAREPGLDQADVLASVTTTSFDIAALELFLPLVTGARMVVVPREEASDGVALCRRLAESCATTMQATPATWQLLLDAGWRPPSGFTALCGGEALSADLARRLLATGAVTWNLYGPTETTIWSTVHRLTGSENALRPGNPMPLGRPIDNTRLQVLDDSGRQVPLGVPGELVIAGAGVALGYLGRPELTDERFLPADEAPGARRYRTGDLVRFRAGGELEFLGRKDFQVKLRGFRVEPGEIEAVLLEHPAVREAVVLAREDRPGDRRLVGYLVPRSDHDGTGLADELREHARTRLPEYMLPAHLVVLESLPLSANGKVDRAALPAPDTAPQDSGEPRTPVEREVARLFAEALGLPRVGLHDDFFQLGGHSLLATRVLAEVRRTWGLELAVRVLFQRPTVAEIAAVVETGDENAGTDGPDLESEVHLDLVVSPGPPRGLPRPREVFLTGATGFLGAHLLERVLSETDAVAHCLVRAENEDQAQRRLIARLRDFGICDERLVGRVRAVPGTLAEPRFGLTPGEFQDLAERCDEIYHVGADVNFLRPFRSLAPANVDGVREVLRLAARGPVSPVHHVSTFSVLPMQHDGDEPHREDSLPLDAPPENGYNQSKWVAERVVELARREGLPVSVYRPGRVTGHSITGRWNTDDITARVFRACVETGLVPDAELAADLLPVDFVAAAIARLARHPESPGHNFHFRGRRPFRLPDLAEVLTAEGFPVRPASFEDWLDACRERTARDPDSDLGPTASLFAHRMALHEQGLRDPGVDASNTERLLGEDGPLVDASVVRRYVRHLADTGFLPIPTAERHEP